MTVEEVINAVADIWFDENGEYDDCTQYEVLRDVLGYKGEELESLNNLCYEHFFDED